MKSKRILICYRVKPCSCGCLGRDPWHPTHFKRIIREVVEETGTCRTHAYGYSHEYGYTKRGVAKFPWGKTRVYFIQTTIRGTDRVIDLGWFIGNGDEDDLQ